MPGVKALRKIQLGEESTAGTAVAATALWRGRGVIEDQRETVFPEEDVGYLSGVDRSYQPKLYAALSMETIEATFEQLPYILQAGIDEATPVQDGTGSDYVYSYAFPTTSAPTPLTYTLEGGDDQQAEEMEYGFVEKFTLEGKAGEAWMVGADWKGRQVQTASFTGAIALPSVEEMLFSKTKLYIDAFDGTIGTTQKSNTLLEASLEVMTGLVPVWTADGNLYFSFTKSVPSEIVLTLTFEHDGTATAEKAFWQSQTTRLIRLLCEGDAVATPGTTYSNKTMIIDLAGRWEKFDPLGDQDGNDIVKAAFRARYNSTAALYAEMVIVNELSALP